MMAQVDKLAEQTLTLPRVPGNLVIVNDGSFK
jgi:hypothetical protein